MFHIKYPPHAPNIHLYILKGGIFNTVSLTLSAVSALLIEIMFTLWIMGITTISTVTFLVPILIISWSGFVLGILFFIFLILHGRKFDDKYLKYAGILFLVNTIINILLIPIIINLINFNPYLGL